MSEKLLTVEEVAQRLNRSPAQIRYMKYKGTGPKFAKLAGRVMARESDVEAYIAAAFEEASA